MTERENTNNAAKELGLNQFVKILESGYQNVSKNVITNMLRHNIITPGKREPSRRAVYSPHDLFRAACALELKPVCSRWKDVARSIGSPAHSPLGNRVRASKEWKTVYDFAVKQGVNFDNYTNLAPKEHLEE